MAEITHESIGESIILKLDNKRIGFKNIEPGEVPGQVKKKNNVISHYQ